MLSWHFYHNALWNQVKKKKTESTTVKHKIDGALNQNTNSNQNFKTNQIRTKKEEEAKLTHLSLGGKRTCSGAS